MPISPSIPATIPSAMVPGMLGVPASSRAETSAFHRTSSIDTSSTAPPPTPPTTRSPSNASRRPISTPREPGAYSLCPDTIT